MPEISSDDLERQVSELTDALADAEHRRAEAENRWTAGLLNFAGQLEEAFERGRARGWAECARHFGLPAAQGRHRRRHLSAVPGGAAGVAAAAVWRLAGTAKTATSAAGMLARHTAAHSAAVTGVAAAGVVTVGVTVALAPPASHASAAPPVSSRPVSAASMPAAPVTPWRPVRAPAGVTVASAAPDHSPPPVPVTAPAAAAPVVSATAPAPPVSDPVPRASTPVPVPVSASAVAADTGPVTSRVRHRLHSLEHAVDGVTSTYAGHHRRGLPVPVPSVPASVLPVAVPSVLGG